MPIIDTSFLVALFNQADEHHGTALGQAGRPGTLIIPAVVLHEFLLVVAQRTAGPKLAGRKAARSALQDIRSQPAFLLETDYDVNGVADVYAADSRLSYADAVGLVLSRDRNEELWTFDEDQRSAASR